MHAKIKYMELYLIRSFMYRKKIHQFLSCIKKDALKENWFFFSAPGVTLRTAISVYFTYFLRGVRELVIVVREQPLCRCRDLTAAGGVCRYLFIRYPRHGAIWCSVGRARLSIVVVNLVTLVVCIPNVTLRPRPGAAPGGSSASRTS